VTYLEKSCIWLQYLAEIQFQTMASLEDKDKKMQTAFLKANRRKSLIASEPQVTHDSNARIAKRFDDVLVLSFNKRKSIK
jgi:hypothetical protein